MERKEFLNIDKIEMKRVFFNVYYKLKILLLV